MTAIILIWRNLWRSRTRTLLTVASLAVSLFLFTMLLATIDSMRAVAETSAAELRLVVHHRTTMTKLLPLGLGPRIAAMPGVASVCPMRWFGGRPEGTQEQFPSMAVDRDTLPIVFDDLHLTSDTVDLWGHQRTAAVLGVGLAKRLGCGAGDRIVLTGTIPPYLKLEFRVVGITIAPAYPNVFVFRLDYLLDSLRANPVMPEEYNNSVNMFWVRARSPDEINEIRTAIDASFANSPDPTVTEFEESFVAQFTKMFGDIPSILRRIGLVVVASILLVVCNSVSSAVRERMNELAVLKALGYSTRRLVALLLAESVLLGVMASAACVLALLALGISAGSGLSMPYFPIVSASPGVIVIGACVSLCISCVAVVLPALRVARLSVARTIRVTG